MKPSASLSSEESSAGSAGEVVRAAVVGAGDAAATETTLVDSVRGAELTRVEFDEERRMAVGRMGSKVSMVTGKVRTTEAGRRY